MSGSPNAHSRAPGGSRSASVQGRPSNELMPGVTEEDEEEEEEYEDEPFGPELNIPAADQATEMISEPISPLSPLPGEEDNPLDATPVDIKPGGVPLTAEALKRLSEDQAKKEAEEASLEEEKEKADSLRKAAAPI